MKKFISLVLICLCSSSLALASVICQKTSRPEESPLLFSQLTLTGFNGGVNILEYDTTLLPVKNGHEGAKFVGIVMRARSQLTLTYLGGSAKNIQLIVSALDRGSQTALYACK